MIPNSLKEEIDEIRAFLASEKVPLVNQLLRDESVTAQALEGELPQVVLTFYLNFLGGRTDVFEGLDLDAQQAISQVRTELTNTLPTLESNRALKERAQMVRRASDLFRDLRTPEPTEQAFNQFDGVAAIQAWQAEEGELTPAARLLFVRSRKVLFDTTLDLPGLIALAKAVLEISVSTAEEAKRFKSAGVPIRRFIDLEAEMRRDIEDLSNQCKGLVKALSVES